MMTMQRQREEAEAREVAGEAYKRANTQIFAHQQKLPSGQG